MPPLFFGWLIGFIGSLFIKIGEVVFDVMRAVGPWVQTIVQTVRDVVNVMASNIGRFFRFIANAARGLLDHVVSPVMRALQRWFERFQGFLDRVFGPIRAVLKWVNEFLDKVWTKVIAPILDVIDKIRLVFRTLEQLGFEWAGAVERFLRDLETRIFDAFREVRTFVNTIFSWVDLLSDPRGWIRSTPFLWTVFQYSGNIWNLLIKLGANPLTKPRLQLARGANGPKAIDATVDRLKTGVLRQDFRMQGTVARFRSRKSGTL